jgi:hypothetical protein
MVPIDTRIEGDPESIRAAASWLRSSLQPALDHCGSQVYRARTTAEAGWQGSAGDAFRDKMSVAGKAIDSLHADGGALSASFDDYAASLQTAQAGMRRARQVALAGGLGVEGDVIEDPGPAPAEPQPLPDSGTVSPQLAAAHQSAVTAVREHQAKVVAYTEAKGEADRANGIIDGARTAARAAWQDLSGKRYLHATDFTNGVAGGLIEIQRDSLRKQAAFLREEAAKFDYFYLHSPGGSDEAMGHEKMRFENVMKAARLDGEADTGALARIGGKVPVVGLAVSAAGVGWDIAHGKPAGKAILSGALGTGAAFGMDAVAAAALPAGLVDAAPLLAVAGPVGLGIAAGVGVGLLADYAWDHWLPSGAKHAIEDGLDTVGHDVAGGAKALWHDVTSIF